MIDPDDKENIAYNYSFPKGKASYKSDDFDDDLGCVTLSESEDDATPDIGAVAVTEEFLNQAEKCLMDIEQFETEEEIKMELINLLYSHIQLQRQGTKAAGPITYKLLKESLAPRSEPRKDSYEDDELDEEFFKPFEGRELELEDDDGSEAVLEPEPDHHTDSNHLNHEEVAIKPKKTFEEILEEELRKESAALQEEERKELDKQLMPPPPAKTTPKRKFLKRGEGIARFNGAPVRKPASKSKPAMKSDTNGPKRMVGLIRPGKAEKTVGRPNKLPSKIKIEDPISVIPGRDPVKAIRSKPVMSPVRLSPENSPSKSPQHSISHRLKNSGNCNNNNNNNVAEISGFLKPEELEERMAAEEEELEEFRMLEQAAADKSINSLIGMLKFTPSSVVKTPTCHTVEEREEEEVEELAKVEELEEENFDDTETWGFRTPVKHGSGEINIEEEVQTGVLQGALQGALQGVQTGVQDGLQCNGGTEPASSHLTHNGVSANTAAARSENIGPSKLLGSLFPGLKPAPPPPPPQPDVKKPDPESESLKAELKSKLAELEKEVARFQQEAAGLARARAEKESELRKLRQENDKYVEDLEEREKKFQEFKDRELKMIRSEKKQFEMTQLSAKQRAAKLELVDNLTERVQSLEEELTRKEERWNATFTRLKNKAEVKEKECEELHQQISVLEQEKIALWEKEVIRTSNRRHKHAQTDEQTNKPTVRTQAEPTACEDTIKPSLVSRHPQLASLNTAEPSRKYFNEVKFGESTEFEEALQKKCPKEIPEKKTLVSDMVTNEAVYVNLMNHASPPPGDVIAGKERENGHVSSVKERENGHVPSVKEREPTFSSDSPTSSNSTLTSQSNVTKSAVETIGSDGSVTVKYGNGTVKHVSPDGRVVTMTYFNGDTKKTYHDGRVVYTFLKDGITQTQLPDGTERTVFPTGQEETKFADKRVEIKYPDKSTKVTFPNGEEKSVYADGTVVTLDKAGQRLILLPNGQREVHTSAFKRREYPDGTSKTVYNDGRQETIHSNGRIRKKDPNGNLISDVVVDSNGKIIQDYLAKR